MKDGICPKCESKEIYVVDGSRTGVTIPIGMLSTSAFVAMYVCVKCGYVEFYVEDQSDLQRIAQKWEKY